ncbi:hypothetical protein HAX54_015076 [Datura stramonium]|uniref:Uncharacterized protein n=1 Tax=Datura stramonium TaxID=4076 RepID=A0ABS8TRG9_DATST|nr:hypothetical protein [Datura stramonium]
MHDVIRELWEARNMNFVNIVREKSDQNPCNFSSMSQGRISIQYVMFKVAKITEALHFAGFYEPCWLQTYCISATFLHEELVVPKYLYRLIRNHVISSILKTPYCTTYIDIEKEGHMAYAAITCLMSTIHQSMQLTGCNLQLIYEKLESLRANLEKPGK